MKLEESEQKITSEELANFEKQFKLNLPEAYKKIILEYNGGFPEKPYFKEKEIIFNAIKYGFDPVENDINDLKDIVPKNFYPFGRDGGGWYFCMDLTAGEKYGKIYFCPMDGDEPEFLADTFGEFMDKLSYDPDC